MIKGKEKEFGILIAEDDDDDYLLTKKALQEARFGGSFYRVKDGEELMRHLLHYHSTQAGGSDKISLLLLLDLSMPRKDGREALREIKSHSDLKKIPVVVLTTSSAESDIAMAYELGANSFIRKPASFGLFVEAMKYMVQYWFEVSELPCQRNIARNSI